MQTDVASHQSHCEGNERTGPAAGCCPWHMLCHPHRIHWRGTTPVGEAHNECDYGLHCAAGVAAGCARRVAGVGTHAQRSLRL